VDDNKELCKNLSDILELEGCEVAVVHNGFQAIEAVKEDKFNIVLMDIKMPGMNGTETLNILRKIAPKIAIIMITAFADDVIYKDGLRDIGLEVMQKPIDIDKLLVLVKKIC
jgi:DNA-binding NtrC family response regulator